MIQILLIWNHKVKTKSDGREHIYISLGSSISGDFWSFAERITEIENTAWISLVNGLFHLTVSKDRCAFYILNVRMWKER